jgi:glycosyltransferase involved in cell wall biosynthesis
LAITMKLKVALVIHGRFYAFDLGRELVRQGVDLTLLTNYPKSVVEKFGLPRACVVNCVSHGIASRMVHRLAGGRSKLFEPALHRWFSCWAGRVLSVRESDVVHSFSGVSEELFQRVSGRRELKALARASAHIKVQSRLLEEEVTRCGVSVDRPSAWMIGREQREYELADVVFVLSSFAHRSFVEQGFPADKLRLLPLGSQLEVFRPKPDVIEQRCERILSGQPLRVLTVGTFSFRKGSLDLAQIAQGAGPNFHFRFVGDQPEEAAALRKKISNFVQFTRRIPQRDLPPVYAKADLFLFPTIEDGYAVVLSQAQANGLPILATPNCAAPDMVKEGETGWILPIRNPAAFLQRLQWCDEHRQELAGMVRKVYHDFKPRDWSDVAGDFINACSELLAKKKPKKAAVVRI